MKFSSAYMLSWPTAETELQEFMLNTSRVSTTLQTNHPEGYMAPAPSYSLLSPFLAILMDSWSTTTPQSPQMKCMPSLMESFVLPPPSALSALNTSRKPEIIMSSSVCSMTSSSTARFSALEVGKSTPRFNTPLMNPTPSHTLKPHPYKQDLTPTLSPLHPHCLVHQHLSLWLPNSSAACFSSSDRGLPLDNAEVEQVLIIIGTSLTESTRKLYGTGLLVFHVYCDTKNVPNSQ